MGLLAAFIVILVIALLWQRHLLRKLKNAHLNLAAEVGAVRRDCAEAITKRNQDILDILEKTGEYTKSLNERLVLLEIEKTAKPAEAEEPPPPRRSFVSQKARAEAGARKG